MANQYLLHLPDGTEYGPIDRTTLEAWSREGRLPPETLVWPEGAPEWLALAKALAAPASSRPPAAPAPSPAEDHPETLPSMRTPAFDGKAPAPPDARRPAAPSPSSGTRTAVLGLLGVALVVALLAGLWAVLGPALAKRRAVAEIRQHARADRRIDAPEVGLVVELPPGWVALKRENPLVARAGARLAVAQPAIRAFGAISAAPEPRRMDDLDGHLDEILRDRLPRVPSQREGARADVQLGRGRGRLVQTTWEDGLAPMQGATVAWADGYDVYTLEAWAPASAGEAFASELDALVRGITPKGTVAARVDTAVDQVAVEVPELSRDALRLLVAERLAGNRGVDDVPLAALHMVSRGLDALGAAEAAEMRAIYQQVWSPVPEADRVRLAYLMNEVKAGRRVGPEDVLALRTAVKGGVLALPEDQRARLQELSDRAVRKAVLLP
jgi:hypothetical protein